jgi:hypothetical protein
VGAAWFCAHTVILSSRLLFPQPHSATAAVFLDELDAGQGAPNLRNVTQYYCCFFSSALPRFRPECAAAAPVRRTPG